MRYKILIGSYHPETAHTEIEADSFEDAKAWLHALARKAKPEPAIADIGDHRGWISNKNFEKVDLSSDRFARLLERVRFLIECEDELDDAAIRADSTWVPDIRITPTAEGVAFVESSAMQFESHCKWDRIPALVSDLIREYQDLVSAGELSHPEHGPRRFEPSDRDFIGSFTVPISR